VVKTIVIADDNTGANASTILLNKLNFTTLSLIDYRNTVPLEEFDAVAISTDSRSIEPKQAYERIQEVLKSLSHIEPLIYNKRIDSTLRGNLGVELDAFMDYLPGKKAAVVPSFPNSKRTCMNGKVYVDGNELKDTDVAKDPKMPIFTSEAKELFQKQTQRKITNIFLDDIRGNDLLCQLITKTYQAYDIIIFDAETNEDIKTICIVLAKCQHDVICVDPGPLTYYYTRTLINKINSLDQKFIYLVGSVVDTTYEQLNQIKHDKDFEYIYIDPVKLIDTVCEKELIDEITHLVMECSKKFICITTTDIENRKVLNLKQIGEVQNCCAEDVSNRINSHLAAIVVNIIDQYPWIAGVFCSGGDTALGFLTSTDAKGINLVQEVMPLSVFGKIVGGSCNGMPIITKGGMIGDKNAYIKIKEFFEEANLHE
jgi:D-threonate/D-erythronate kinase